MPLIYRAMTREGGHPKVGTTARTLGVRLTEDIPVRDGLVLPGTGGMSVAPSWREIAQHRIPKRFIFLVPDAAGSNADSCWWMGEGPFVPGTVAPGLDLRPDRPGHGVVEPDRVMSPDEFQGWLAATRDLWRLIDEELNRV